MTKDEIYEIWSPAESPWSRWVKPVLFSFLAEGELRRKQYPVPHWHVPLAADTAMIADLPGENGVRIGVALSRNGYRPIPVYNASPVAIYTEYAEAPISIMRYEPLPVPAVVDLFPVMSALCGTAQRLVSANLPASAPPVFLLDSKRKGWTLSPEIGWFDNRSFVSATDFPSAGFFLELEISRIVLIQNEPKIQSDLLEVLLVLQRNGLTIARQEPEEEWAPQPFIVKRPMLPVHLWGKLRRALGYRREPDGTFGQIVPANS